MNNHSDHFIEDGDFSFIKDKHWGKSLKNAYNTITINNLWDFFKTECPPNGKGYLYWEHPNINKIGYLLSMDGHSGASFAICMRNMEYIAKNGWSAYVDHVSGKE